MTDPFTMSVTLTIQPERREEFLGALDAVLGPARAEPGCVFLHQTRLWETRCPTAASPPRSRRTPGLRESAQSAIAANFNASFREPGRYFFCEVHLHLQLADRGVRVPDLTAQPRQLRPLALGQPRVRGQRRVPVLPQPLHPLPQRHLMHADIPGHLRDRPPISKDEPYRLLLVLIRETPPSRTHR